MFVQIGELIEKFFSMNAPDKNAQFSVVRSDGITVYPISSSSVENGVLAIGAWQAATGLLSRIGSKSRVEFRLSFDTSSDGIYVLPFTFKDDEFILVASFNSAINPALVKNRARNLRDGLCKFLSEQLSKNIKDISVTDSVSNSKTLLPNFERSNDRKSYLFKDISDDEIDELFSRIG